MIIRRMQEDRLKKFLYQVYFTMNLYVNVGGIYK